jgi:N-acetylneuraminate synthase
MLDLKSRDCPYIIAEAGTCHASRIPEERLPKALQYVRAAFECKVDAIKFQMFANPIVQPDMFCWIEGDEKRSERWVQSELSFDEWFAVKREAEGAGLDFLASVFQHTTVAWLNQLAVVATKVASRATTRFPYGYAPLPLLISTGMGFPPEELLDDQTAFLIECESNYPSTAYWGGDLPGFSDHSANPALAIDAMRRGCKLIEVHFYINPEDAGPDLPASLTLDQLKTITHARNALVV